MEHNQNANLRSGRFYAALVLVLLAVGVGSYSLLSRQARQSQTDAVTDSAAEVLSPVQQVTDTAAVQIQEVENETVETTSLALTEEPAPQVRVITPELEAAPTPVKASEPVLIVAPLQGDVVTAFAADQLVYSETLEDWRTHEAIDISADIGTAVLAACSGTVVSVEDDPLMGTTVVIEHDGGCRTTYANLQAEPAVSVRDTVSAGQIIGAVGSTAAAEAAQEPHLHFSVTQDGAPVDPNEFLA